MSGQMDRYRDFYGHWDRLRWLFRFDVRYRCRRLRQVLRQLEFREEEARVLDFGFGHGDLLAALPASTRLRGVDISPSAVAAARADPRFSHFTEAEFATVPERGLGAVFPGEFDLVLSSHTLEHVADDAALLRELHDRLASDGLLVLFVPIEEPDYIRFHLRNYSLQSIRERVTQAGFDIVLVEGSMQVNGHLWKLLTIPSRRSWPVVGPLVNALRLGTLSLLPYRLVRLFDGLLDALGCGPRQALIVARKRVTCRAAA
jgi:SAM-dependent methyltransferase